MSSNKEFAEQEVLDLIPQSQKIFGSLVYWIAIICMVGAFFTPVFILANPKANILNPNISFSQIFNGTSPLEIWECSSFGNFPGAHFYLTHIENSDSIAMIFIAVSCSFGLFGLIPAVIYQVVVERDWYSAILGIIVSIIIVLSSFGFLNF